MKYCNKKEGLFSISNQNWRLRILVFVLFGYQGNGTWTKANFGSFYELAKKKLASIISEQLYEWLEPS